MSRNGRINERQKLRLFDLMSRNYVALFGRFTSINGTHAKEDLWIKIKNDLNLMGPQKSVEQWKNCWRDLKKSARTKFMQIRQYKTKTGGGPPCPYVLTDHEQIIMSICNLEALDGVDGQELGFKQTPPRDPVPSLFRSRSTSHSRSHEYTSSHASSRSRSPNGKSMLDSRPHLPISRETEFDRSYQSKLPSDESMDEVQRHSPEKYGVDSHQSGSHVSSRSRSPNGISMIDSRRHSPISRETEFDRSYQSKLPSDASMDEVQRHSSKKYGVDSHRSGRSQSSDKPMPYDNRSADSDNALENEVVTHSRSSKSTHDVIVVSSESDDSIKSFEKRKQALIATKKSLNRECFGDLITQNQSHHVSLSSLRGQPWDLFRETLSKSREAVRASESFKDHSRHEPLSNYESILYSTPGILNDDHSVTPCDPTRISIDQQSSSQTVAASILNCNRSRSPSVSSEFSTSTRISHRCASSFSNCLASHSFSLNAGRTSATSPSLSHRSTSNSSSRSCNAVRNCANISSLSHRSTSHSSSRSYNAGRTSATSRSSPQRSTSNSSPRRFNAGRGCASLHHHSTSHSSSRSCNAGRTCGASSSSHCCLTSRSSSTARGTSRTLPPSTATSVSHRSSTSSFSSRGNNVNTSLIPTIRTTANNSFQRPNPVHHRHHRALNSHRSSRNSSRHSERDRSFRSGSELNSTSDRSYHTIGESSNSGALSRRNLTGSLAQSVQAAAAIQRSIERNIMSLRDGQEDVVAVLQDCLKELRRRN